MLRIIRVMSLLAALFPLSPAQAIDVLGGCREVTSQDTLLLLNLNCRDEEDCWPDPDDVHIADAKTGEAADSGINNMVWLDKNGEILDDMPETYPLRAIWDMSATHRILPEKIRLEYDGEAITRDISLENSCAKIPKEVFKALGIKRK